MKMIAFARRNTIEILRDKLNLCFGIGFPVILLLLLSLIQRNIPVEMFALERLTPGICSFGLSFMTLFSAMLIAKDRSGSFILRLYTSPMKSVDFILGYTLPLLPISIAQSLVCFAVALILGLKFTADIFVCILVLIPVAVLYIAVGLLCGSIFTDKQVGGICGALLTNLSAWLSGTWFDISLVGGTLKKIAECLPFYRAVEAGRNALAGNYTDIMGDLWWVIVYAVILTVVAVIVFEYKMKSDK